jgi:hypothetical protein
MPLNAENAIQMFMPPKKSQQLAKNFTKCASNAVDTYFQLQENIFPSLNFFISSYSILPHVSA